MSNNYGIPIKLELEIRKRDKNCIYCNKEMLEEYIHYNHKSSPTIEHLCENLKCPGLWKDGLKKEWFGICCGECNSSRGNKSLEEWFKEDYCKKNRINNASVSNIVKIFIKEHKC